jgi:hypothetical protein
VEPATVGDGLFEAWVAVAPVVVDGEVDGSVGGTVVVTGCDEGGPVAGAGDGCGAGASPVVVSIVLTGTDVARVGLGDGRAVLPQGSA